MLDNIISRDDFAAQVQTELADLLKSTKAEYADDLKTLSGQFAEQYYKFLNATTAADCRRAEANIAHIKASLTHISARMGLDLTERLIKICMTVLTIAATAAIRAII